MTVHEELPIDQLKVNPKNPRTIRDDSFKQLVKSVKQFPKMLDIRRVVIDENDIIQGGEKRWLAAKDAGFKTIPVTRVIGMTDKEKQEFILKDNIHYGEFDTTALMDWDIDILKDAGLWNDPGETHAQETIVRKTGMRQIVFRYTETEYNRVMKELQIFMQQEGYEKREDFLKFLLDMDQPKK